MITRVKKEFPNLILGGMMGLILTMGVSFVLDYTGGAERWLVFEKLHFISSENQVLTFQSDIDFKKSQFPLDFDNSLYCDVDNTDRFTKYSTWKRDEAMTVAQVYRIEAVWDYPTILPDVVTGEMVDSVPAIGTECYMNSKLTAVRSKTKPEKNKAVQQLSDKFIVK